MNDKNDSISMRVTGLTIDPFSNMPIVILKDESEQVALPIWIGLIEASAIATEIEKVEVTRPMTHDVMKTLMQNVDVKLVRVEIYDLTDNTFFARMIFATSKGEFEIEARPSDAIAMAMRCKTAINVARKVIDKSRKLATPNVHEEKLANEKWTEILENLTSEDFGKYKM